MNLADYITIDANVRFGKPCVKGTRISVDDVLGWLASGMSQEDILTDYPSLSVEKIRACLSYAADRENRFRVVS